MFWTMAMLVLLCSYVVGGFTPVVLLLALTTIMFRLKRGRQARLAPITAAAKKSP